MVREKTRMPMSTAGITSYYEEYRSSIEISPQQVILLGLLIAALTIALHIWGAGLLQ
ncbi:preprotein translocase subunit Sec61beta [Candidatus Woesearchaeota archaeon]|nr:MAG: preprotein translocase subunit Sec61beta [Candidatus Woesearchaeota archaeon]